MGSIHHFLTKGGQHPAGESPLCGIGMYCKKKKLFLQLYIDRLKSERERKKTILISKTKESSTG